MINSELFGRVLFSVQSAGLAAMQIYAPYKAGTLSDVGIAMKGDSSPLTKADLAAHSVLVDDLAELTASVPVVSEEDAGSLVYRKPIGSFWLVDPLDGTKEFIARNDEFTVNVALVTDGQPVWGAVYAPALDLLYWGGRGYGAYRQCAAQVESICIALPLAANAKYRVVASKSHLNSETSAFIAGLGEVCLIQAGSSLKLCRVAEGAADIYPRLANTYEWDTAAGHAVLEGAGGYVVDTAGQPLVYGKTNVLNPHFIASSLPLARLGYKL